MLTPDHHIALLMDLADKRIQIANLIAEIQRLNAVVVELTPKPRRKPAPAAV